MNELSVYRKLISGYVGLCLLFSSFLILVILLNCSAWVFLHWREQVRLFRSKPVNGQYFQDDGAPIADGKLMDALVDSFDEKATPEIPSEQTHALLVEFSKFVRQGMVYAPWSQVSEGEFSGLFIHTAKDRLDYIARKTVHPYTQPTAKTKTIYIFGGSTTFGYLVSDENTWPSRLANLLNDKAGGRDAKVNFDIVNFGHAAYDSSQEAAMALYLLKNAPPPEAMIFMDGVDEHLSEPNDVPTVGSEIETAFRLTQDQTLKGDLDRFLFFIKNFAIYQAYVQETSVAEVEKPQQTKEILNPIADKIFQRYRANVAVIKEATRLSGSKALFFSQPDAYFNYSMPLYRRGLANSFFDKRLMHTRFYELVKTNLPEVHDFSGMFKDWGDKRKAIVDEVNYSPSFNDFVARRIADVLMRENTGLFN